MGMASKIGQVNFVKQGLQGPMLYPYGEYSSTVSYTRDEKVCPMVLEGTVYYALAQIGTFTGVDPATDVANNGGIWFVVENYKAMFVEMFMANFGKIASAVFSGDYMISQHGKDADGNDSTAYTNFGTSAFTPNLLLNFLTGEAILNKFKANDAQVSGRFSVPFKSISDGSQADFSKWYNYEGCGINNEIINIQLPTTDFESGVTCSFGIGILGACSLRIKGYIMYGHETLDYIHVLNQGSPIQLISAVRMGYDDNYIFWHLLPTYNTISSSVQTDSNSKKYIDIS